VEVRLGEPLRGIQALAVGAVAPLRRQPLPVGVRSVAASRTELTLKLRNGLELRLGDGADLPVKLEVARRILPGLHEREGYLDLSVPERPVLGTTLDSQVEVDTPISTDP
jgi:hypothetical protein